MASASSSKVSAGSSASTSASKRKAKPVAAALATAAVAPSSNWKKLRQTMPVSIAAQELGSASTSSSRKRKRGASAETATSRGTTASHSEEAGQGLDPRPSAALDIKGKGKAKERLLGEDGVTGTRAEPGQYVSLDCEFVGLYDPANDHAEHSLARVSIVNFHGAIVLDTFVAQRERIGDWRTWVSGVRPEDVKGAPSYEEVQKQVADILKGRILVGHAVQNDLKVLLLSHPGPQIRDTSKYGPLRELAGTKRPSLKNLSKKACGIDIQDGEHSSVTDARATMAIYRSVQKDWESTLRGHSVNKKAKLKVANKEVGDTPASGSSSKGRRNDGPRMKGGPAPRGNGTLGLASTISKQRDWWSSGTLS